MIQPSKHDHPDRTAMYASAVLLKEIKRRRVVSFERLHSILERKILHGEKLFELSISLLFLLGLVRYHKKTDKFEYSGK